MKKTEILVTLQAVLCYISSRMIEMFVQMLKVYFADKDILDKLELGQTKIGYLVQFDLASYYAAQIFSLLLPETGFPPKFVYCFDETGIGSHFWILCFFHVNCLGGWNQ